MDLSEFFRVVVTNGHGKEFWDEWVSKQREENNNNNLTLKIQLNSFSRNIDCKNWDFKGFDIEISAIGGDQSYSLDLSGCEFKSFKTNSSNEYPFRRSINFSNCKFYGDVDIEIHSNDAPNFENAEFFSTQNKIKIQSNHKLSLKSICFDNKEGSFDLDLHNKDIALDDINFLAKEVKIKAKTSNSNLVIKNSKFAKNASLIFEGSNSSINIDSDISGQSKDNKNEVSFNNFKNIILLKLENSNITFSLNQQLSLEAKSIQNCKISKNEKNNQFWTFTISTKLISCCEFSNFDVTIKEGSNTPIDEFVIQSSTFETLSIEGVCKIIDCNISTLFLPRRHLTIEKSYIRYFRTDLNLEHLEVRDSEINKIIFNCDFKSCAIFSNVVFKEAPEIYSIKFTNHNVDFRNVKFQCKNGGIAIGSFRALVKACQDAGYEHGVILFHGLELETYYNNQLKNVKFRPNIRSFKVLKEWFGQLGELPEKVCSIFNRCFTNYGRNLMLPLIWMLVIWFFGTLVNKYCDYHLPPIILKLDNGELDSNQVISRLKTLKIEGDDPYKALYEDVKGADLNRMKEILGVLLGGDPNAVSIILNNGKEIVKDGDNFKIGDNSTLSEERLDQFKSDGWQGDYKNEWQKPMFISFKHSIGPMQFAIPKTPDAQSQKNNDKVEYLRDAKLNSNVAIIFAFFQTIVSSIIWFLLILMIRRRFKI